MLELELKVGQSHPLPLRGRGSAGYSWHADVTGPDGVIEVRRAPARSPPRSPGGLPPDNASLPETFELLAIGEGRVRIHLSLRRPWEGDAAPLKEDEFDVVVTP